MTTKNASLIIRANRKSLVHADGTRSKWTDFVQIDDKRLLCEIEEDVYEVIAQAYFNETGKWHTDMHHEREFKRAQSIAQTLA